MKGYFHTTLVDTAGATMQKIVASTSKVAGILNEMMSASHEQDVGIGQGKQAIAKLDNNTGRNAALVEQAAAAAPSMQEPTVKRGRIIGGCRLYEGAQARALPAAPLAKRPGTPSESLAIRR